MTTIAPAPAPNSTPPPPLSGGGRTTIRVLLVAAAVLLVLGSLGGLAATAVTLGSTRAVADSQPLPPNMRSLTIDTGQLDVGVRITADPQATEPRVDMRFVNTARTGDQALLVSSEGANARIALRGGNRGWLDWTDTGEVTLVLPPDLARRLTVSTKQQDGLLLADADLERLVVQISDGAVILRGGARSIEVNAQDGSVISRDPIAVRESFTVTTVDGDISVGFAESPPQTIQATSADGDISIGLPKSGPYAVTTQSNDPEGADISVDRTDDPSRAVATLLIRTNDGSITVARD